MMLTEVCDGDCQNEIANLSSNLQTAFHRRKHASSGAAWGNPLEQL